MEALWKVLLTVKSYIRDTDIRFLNLEGKQMSYWYVINALETKARKIAPWMSLKEKKIALEKGLAYQIHSRVVSYKASRSKMSHVRVKMNKILTFVIGYDYGIGHRSTIVRDLYVHCN